MYQPSDYIPKDLKIEKWDDIQSYFNKLLSDNINDLKDLEACILHYSEVLSVFHEQFARVYINMTCHTEDEEAQKKYETFATVIMPELDKASDQVRKKIAQSSFFKQLPAKRYSQLIKGIERDNELFCIENVSLEAKLSSLAAKYGKIVGGLFVTLEGKKLTLPQASVYLESDDEQKRKEAWLGIMEARKVVKDDLDGIMDEMIALRHQVAQNASYENYRDYKHDELHRFDYSVDDVICFSQSIKKHVVPLLTKMTLRHRQLLGLTKNNYFPWDSHAKPKGQKPLRPFQSADELLKKTIQVFHRIRPEFADNLKEMHQAKLFDLASRPGKAPGGYNYGLEMTGMPFIFMNAAGVHRDVITLMHEGGHAMQTFLTSDESLIQYRNYPSEIGEVASMSMELISSRYWDEFYNQQDVLRARIDHLEDIVSVFSWVAVVDSFQQWLYTHHKHSANERDQSFVSIYSNYETGLTNWQGNEVFQQMLWQKQLHIFEVPFYYIEYAIAQLGALQVYQNYVKDPDKALKAYMAGLSLGNSLSIPEVWDTLNIQFDFSENKLASLMSFIEKEWQGLCEEHDGLNHS